MTNISQLLSRLGLGEKEVKIFLALTKLGSSSVSSIADESGVTRTHVYDIAEDLQKKGLLTKIEEKNTRKYEAIGYADLLAYISRQQKELQFLENDFIKAASVFDALQVGKNQRTKIRFFEGKEGIENIYDEIRRDLKKQLFSSELLTIFSPARLESLLPGWMKSKKYIDVAHEMTKRGIIYESEVGRQYVDLMKKSQNKHCYKAWPKGEDDFTTDVLCWLDKIVFIDVVDHPSGIVIESSAIVKSFKMWFEFMWADLEQF